MIVGLQPTERRLNEDFDKQVDLHESEWHHEKKREPFFGPNARVFACYVIGAAIMYPVSRFIVFDVLALWFPILSR
jgi:hypothetical protein